MKGTTQTGITTEMLRIVVKELKFIKNLEKFVYLIVPMSNQIQKNYINRFVRQVTQRVHPT